MNEKDIQSLEWEGKDRVIRIEQGLYLNVRRSSRTYIVRKTVRGKQHVITLGKSPALSLKKARLLAAQYAVDNNVNNITVSRLISEYRKDEVDPKSKVPRQVNGYLSHIDNNLGSRKVSEVEKHELVNFIKRYSAERGARSADRVRSYLKQLFSYGVELGYVKQSPMDGVTKRVTGYHPVERKRTLSHDEIRAIWNWKNPDHGWRKTEDNARFLKFLLLTGLRIREAQTGYVDGDKYRIDDTKGKHPKHEKRPHWIYLTESAKACLPLPQCTHTNIQAWLKRKLLAAGYNDSDRYTSHDLRRTFATLANEASINPFIVERTLNHKMQGVMSTYNHAEYENERIECAKAVEEAVIKILISVSLD